MSDQTADMLMDVTVPYVYRYRAALVAVAGADDFVDGHSELCWCRHASWLDHETTCRNVRDLLGRATWWIPAPSVGEPTPPLREPHPALPDANHQASPARSRTEGEG